MSFFSLPVEVVQGPIFSFLTPLCLSQLDGAVANRYLRKYLLEYFKLAVVRNVQEEDEPMFRLDIASSQWLLSRKVNFTSVSVGDSGMSEHYEELSFVLAKALHVECGLGFSSCDNAVKMLQHCQKLQSLSIGFEDNITDSVLSAITVQHSELKVLKMKSCEGLTSNRLQGIMRNCTFLQQLSIGKSGNLDANQLACSLCQLRNLRWLDVNSARFLTHDWEMIFDHCSLLEHINMSYTNFSPETMTYMGRKCPLITSVKMCGSGDDTIVTALAHAFPRLQELDARNSEKLESTGITELATHCKNLRKLVISGCGVTNEVFSALAQNCPHLIHLDCLFAVGDEASDVGITKLVQACTKLETLILPYFIVITDVFVMALAQNCAQLQMIVGLKGRNFGDASIIALSTRCPRLRFFTLSNSLVTDASLISLAAYLPGLKEFSFYKCEMISSVGVAALAQRCVGLSSLNIYGCGSVGSDGVIAVVQKCHRLRTLMLTDLPAVTDDFADVCISLTIRAEMNIVRTGVSADKLAQLKQCLKKCTMDG
eukprot:gene9297-10957_t